MTHGRDTTQRPEVEWWSCDEPTPTHLTTPWLEEARTTVEPYLRDFLTSKHPLRSGPVCPYMPAALRRSQMLFVVGTSEDSESQEASRVAEAARAIWTHDRAQGRRFRYTAAVILYPPATSAEYIEEVQYQSKSATVGHHVMVGALHAANNAESIHGGGFYPLRTPSPTIVLRDMVPSDLQFLNSRRFSPTKRLEFYRNYLSAFESSSLEWERKELEEAQKGARDCENRVRRFRIASVVVGCFSTAVLVLAAARSRMS